MVRKLLFVLCAAALVSAGGCGRQVTSNPAGSDTPGGGLAPGFMQIKFRTAQAMDFTNIRYVIAFNTSGTGTEPYPKYCNQANNWLNCSFQIIVGGNGFTGQAQLVQLLRQQGPGGTTVVVPTTIPYAPSDVILQLNSNAQQTEFTVTFNRALLVGLSPSSGATPTPLANTWYINYFTTDPSGNPLDSPGLGGAQDTSFIFNVDVTTNFDRQFTRPPGATPPSNPSALISGGEVLNNP